jgi:4-hydroxy-tetrahydrodipicolinate synthase
MDLKTAVASIALPMTREAEPDYPALRRYLRWLLDDQALRAITVNADTGEGAHLTRDERLRVVECARDEAGDDVVVLSGLIAGHTSLATGLARDLRAAGADGLLVFAPPAFVGHPLPAGVVGDYFAALADTGSPLVAFNLTPALGGVVLEPGTLVQLANAGLLAALKEASFDAKTYLESRNALRSAERPVPFLSGCDNFIGESFVLGADGCLLGFAGLAGRMTAELLDLVRARRFDEADRLAAERVQPLADVLFAAPMRNSRARIKEGLRLLGVLDDVTVRPPLPALSDPERLAVAEAMRKAGLP